MNQSKPRMRDEFYANFLSGSSRFLNGSALADGFVNGHDKLRTLVRWLHPIRVESYYADKDDWPTFEPVVTGSGMLPKNYKSVARISLYRGTVEAEQSKHSCYQAVAFKLGSTVLVGINERGDNTLFQPVPSIDDRLRANMLVGDGLLQASPDLYYSGRKTFLTMHDEHSNEGVIARVDNDQSYV